jgi:proteasome lid subunit RPN8/RPN11
MPYDDGANPPRGPVLYAHPEAWQTIVSLVQECPIEVSGFALIKRESPRRLVLASAEDVFIIDQVATGGSVDSTRANVNLALDRADALDRGNEMRLQFHGHPGDAYFSATDMGNIENYGHCGGTWMVSIVFDRTGGYVARLDMFSPMRSSTELQIRPLDIYDVQAKCRDMLRQHVQREVEVGPHIAGRRRRTTTIGVFDPQPKGA